MAVSAVALWRGSLTATGAAAALLVGTLIVGFGGWQWGLLVGLFFVSSSALSHFKEDQKKSVSEKFDKGSRRDHGQVMANGGVGAFVAVVSAIAPSDIWYPLFVGVMATVTADTWATELGTLSARAPRLITNGQVVEIGSSGAVSLLGTLVSFAGGLLIGLVGGLGDETAVLTMSVIGAVAGLSGSMFDSVLGATVQRIYFCESCQKDTERKLHKCGHPTQPLRGWKWLNNDLVNLWASLVGGVVALGMWLLIVGAPA
jgi:uncharacterized protein (TIGR00297 family)